MTSLEFVNPSGNLTLDESQIISLNPVLTHTGKADLRATVEETRGLDDYAQRQDRLNLISDTNTIWTGYLVGVSHNERQGTSSIRADGIAKRLEETRPDYESLGGPVSYTQTALHDAIRDYWSRTEFTNYTVTDQSTSTVATDSEIQSASTNSEWTNITTIADDVPIVVQNDNLELLQTNYLTEGEDATTSDGLFAEGSDYSGAAPPDGAGGAERFAPGEDGSWEFDIDYVIPEADVGAWFRNVNDSGGTPAGSWYLNGDKLDTVNGSTNTERIALNWDDYAANQLGGEGGGYDGGDLDPANNPHTLEWKSTTTDDRIGETWTANVGTYVDLLEVDLITDSETIYDDVTEYERGTDYEMDYPNGQVKALSGGSITDGQNLEADYIFEPSGVLDVDVVALIDNRYSYNFDNSVTAAADGDNYLDGPELYPDLEEFALDTEKGEFNIVEGSVTSSWNDTSSNQAIALSNDGGSTYDSASNTSTHTVNFPDPGRFAKVKFTLSRYGSGNTTTPSTGFNGQVVNDYSLTVDLNDLVVIDSIDLSRNHFDNLQTLHNYGNFLWVIEHDDVTLGNLVVSSFQEFDETRSSPSEWDNPENKNAEVKAEYYFNSVYLEGAKDSNGDRPTAEVSDSTAISNDGREIQVFLRDLDITTEAGAGFRAQSVLDTALSNNDLVGTIESQPNLVECGFSYLVDFGNGEKEKTLEEIALRLSNDELVASNQFTIRENFGEDISKLQRDARSLEDQV